MAFSGINAQQGKLGNCSGFATFDKSNLLRVTTFIPLPPELNQRKILEDIQIKKQLLQKGGASTASSVVIPPVRYFYNLLVLLSS